MLYTLIEHAKISQSESLLEKTNFPYNVNPESHSKVAKLKEMITNWRSFWVLIKFSLSAP